MIKLVYLIQNEAKMFVRETYVLRLVHLCKSFVKIHKNKHIESTFNTHNIDKIKY